VQTHTSLAAGQLQAAGIRPVPGEKLRYIVRDRHGPPETRVLAAPFFDSLDRYDTQYYLELLAKAVGEVLWPWKSAASQDASKCALTFAASNKKTLTQAIRFML
jgi:DNA polymerase elongation subunit (family B)